MSDELWALLRSRRQSRRLRAVGELRGLSEHEAVPILSEVMYDRSTRVADAAADALRDHFGAAGRGVLLRKLDEDHEWARLVAARSLAEEREPRALAALDLALRSPDADEWGPAMQRIVCFGADARPVIERELLDRNGSSSLREMAAHALVSVAGEEARPTLEEVASTASGRVRAAALRALNRLDVCATRGG